MILPDHIVATGDNKSHGVYPKLITQPARHKLKVAVSNITCWLGVAMCIIFFCWRYYYVCRFLSLFPVVENIRFSDARLRYNKEGLPGWPILGQLKSVNESIKGY